MYINKGGTYNSAYIFWSGVSAMKLPKIQEVNETLIVTDDARGRQLLKDTIEKNELQGWILINSPEPRDNALVIDLQFKKYVKKEITKCDKLIYFLENNFYRLLLFIKKTHNPLAKISALKRVPPNVLDLSDESIESVEIELAIGGFVKESEVREDGVRIIKEFDLREISIVPKK